jgi:hypothetical protein
MYLFSRSARLGPGNPAEQGAWVLSMTEKVNQIVELDVTVWARVFSPGLGTFTWTTTVEDLSALETADAKLVADAGYLDLVEQGAKFDSGAAIDDSLLQVIHADADAADRQLQYATVVDAIIAPGNTASAVQLGVEIAQAVKKATGSPTSFALASTGPYGGVAWFTVFDSLDQMQKAEQDLAADAEFGALVDKAGSAYLPGQANQMVYRRLA